MFWPGCIGRCLIHICLLRDVLRRMDVYDITKEGEHSGITADSPGLSFAGHLKWSDCKRKDNKNFDVDFDYAIAIISHPRCAAHHNHHHPLTAFKLSLSVYTNSHKYTTHKVRASSTGLVTACHHL